jgi:hypothetical protein
VLWRNREEWGGGEGTVRGCGQLALHALVFLGAGTGTRRGRYSELGHNVRFLLKKTKLTTRSHSSVGRGKGEGSCSCALLGGGRDADPRGEEKKGVEEVGHARGP